MSPLKTSFSHVISSVRSFFKRTWHNFRSLKPLYQGLLVLILIIVVGVVTTFARTGTVATTTDSTPTVVLSTVGALSGNATGSDVIGTVRSISEADILAQSGGIVTRINATLGATVPAGFVIASLDNAAQAAVVLQAQGAYDAAVAARNITRIQAGNSQSSFAEAGTAARSTYRSAYTTLDSALTINVDTFFGVETPTGPQLRISPGTSNNLTRRRAALDVTFTTWRAHLATVDSTDPIALLNEAFTNAQTLSAFLTDLAGAANDRDSQATSAQFTALAAARASVDGQLAAISGARDAYNAKQTAAQVGSVQSNSTGTDTASADASVKQALGALRGAQAAYEKTIVRASLSGTLNFLPIHVGDYVTNLMHVATVAQNGSLEVVANISDSDRQSITVGQHLKVENTYDGVVTSVSPALNPVTHQIEMHIAIVRGDGLVNGQSVHITLPDAAASATKTPVSATVTASTTSSAPILIPLTAVKLTPSARVVFSVGADGRLVSNPVEIGDVLGDRIEIIAHLPTDLRIVVDARGLSEGQKVLIAPETP
jgi:multidrug efflux pump subunit AcrA (membrane-fusion protein)